MRSKPPPPARRLRRRRQVLGAVPATLVLWGVLTGLPFSPPAPSQPDVSTEVVRLTGDGAAPTAAAGSVSRARRAAPDEASPGWSASIDVAAGTQATGVTWTGSSSGEVEVRGRTDNGWTSWLPIHADVGEGPDVGPATQGDLAWLSADGVDRVEVRVTEGELQDLRVQSIATDTPSSGGTFAFMPAAGAADTRPSIEPRSSWTTKTWAYDNEDCGSGPKIAAGGVKYAVVHHTVNSNTYASGDVPSMLAAIYTFHTKPVSQGGRGWCDIAYNFVIDRFGRTWEARSGGVQNAIVGGHAAGYNTGSVGVSFLGQYQPGASPAVASPAPSALQAAGKVIGWKLGMGGLDPNSSVTVTSTTAGTTKTIKRVSGHRDVGQTSCPGQLLYDQIATIRATARAVQLQTTVTVPPPTTTTTTRPGATGDLGPFPDETSFVTQQYKDFLGRSPTAAELTRWVAPIRTGSTAPEVFIAELAATPQVDANTYSVIRLYRAYFLRNPDHGGYAYWSTKRVAGWSVSRISQEFALSSEFRNRYGSLANAGFVDRVYRNVMGRSPDAGGNAFWTGQLNKGMTRGQVMASFSESSEYRRTTAAAVQTVGLWELMVRGTISAGTFDYIEPRLRSGATEVSGVARFYLGKPEYAARF